MSEESAGSGADVDAASGPLVVGIGGTLRPGSSTERLLRHCLAAVERRGGRTLHYCGAEIDLPMDNPLDPVRTREAARVVEALRAADAVVVASPGYHGGVSGLVKNALDYIEDLRDDERVYLDGTPWGCIAAAYGWQAAVATLGQLRSIGHALRAWPTPLGLAVNSAEPIWGPDGALCDAAVSGQLDVLAEQLLRRTRADAGPGMSASRSRTRSTCSPPAGW